MGIIHKTFKDSDGFNDFLSKYLDYYVQILNQMKLIDFQPILELILECHKNQKKIIILGNGGSAANATHISTGLSFITRNWKEPIRSLSLSSDSILMSSLANDFSFDEIFSRQLMVHLQPGDLVIALSVSGRSKNVIKAAEFAKSKGNTIIALTGSDGGELIKLTDKFVHIKTPETMFGITEDSHMVFGHALTYYLEYLFSQTP